MDLGAYFAEMVRLGALLIAVPLALTAGMVSFLSPCILPLVPGYLGYVSGLTHPDEPRNRRRVLAGAGLFVLGFALVFTRNSGDLCHSFPVQGAAFPGCRLRLGAKLQLPGAADSPLGVFIDKYRAAKSAPVPHPFGASGPAILSQVV